jgi:hypothetical protein
LKHTWLWWWWLLLLWLRLRLLQLNTCAGAGVRMLRDRCKFRTQPRRALQHSDQSLATRHLNQSIEADLRVIRCYREMYNTVGQTHLLTRLGTESAIDRILKQAELGQSDNTVDYNNTLVRFSFLLMYSGSWPFVAILLLFVSLLACSLCFACSALSAQPPLSPPPTSAMCTSQCARCGRTRGWRGPSISAVVCALNAIL